MDAGLYVNLFEVHFDDVEIQVVQSDRASFKELETLKRKLRDNSYDAWLYSLKDSVIGYGKDVDQLLADGFERASIWLKSTPELASRQIIDGFVEHLRKKGFQSQFKKGRALVFNDSAPIHVAKNGPQLVQGYDLRSLFLWDGVAGELTFALLTDITYGYLGPDGRRLNTHELTSRFGNDALREFRQKQGDILPNRKINLEISRQRLLEQLVPFVTNNATFALPCGVQAQLVTEPMRVIRVEEEKS